MVAAPRLSRREREIMDIVHRSGSATVAQVLEQMTSPPSYSAVRATLTILVQKGHLRRAEEGPRYVYQPTERTDDAGRSALDHVVDTYFDDSAAAVVTALLETRAKRLSGEELDRLASLIDAARREGR